MFRTTLFTLLLALGIPQAWGQLSCCCSDLVVHLYLDAPQEAGRVFLVSQVAGTPYPHPLSNEADTLYDVIGQRHRPYAGQLDPGGLSLRERIGCSTLDTVAWVIMDMSTGRTMTLTFLDVGPYLGDGDVVYRLPFAAGERVLPNTRTRHILASELAVVPTHPTAHDTITITFQAPVALDRPCDQKALYVSPSERSRETGGPEWMPQSNTTCIELFIACSDSSDRSADPPTMRNFNVKLPPQPAGNYLVTLPGSGMSGCTVITSDGGSLAFTVAPVRNIRHR